MNAKLGSLFDGIGGFPLVASWYGIRAVWASEIEAAPISITKRHFPHMLHLGDITKINGAEIEPVDVLSFGSPCQDLSVAGKRAGMKHEGKGDEETTRSGLFMEAIRIIKEMRAATNGKYPRIIIWENVPGAFSSNEGADFQTVLEEICRIADPGLSIPRYTDGWTGAGLIMGDGFSVGWRKLDAQFWGVPQRRKRIYLVADFSGGGAAEILFKPESLRRNTPKGRAPWERFAGGVKASADCTGEDGSLTPYLPQAGFDLQQITSPSNRASITNGAPQPTLCKDGRPHVIAGFCAGQAATAGGIGYAEEQSPTLRAAASGTNQVPAVVIPINDCATRHKGHHSNGLGVGEDGDPAPTVTAGDRHAVMTYQKVTGCLTPGAHPGSYNGQDAYNDMLVAGIDCRNGTENGDLCGTLQAKPGGGYSLNFTHPVRIGLAVRRLIPLETDRLQGYLDDWTRWGHDGKEISDTARYKADGNSVALPCVDYIMSGVADIMDGMSGKAGG